MSFSKGYDIPKVHLCIFAFLEHKKEKYHLNFFKLLFLRDKS